MSLIIINRALEAMRLGARPKRCRHRPPNPRDQQRYNNDGTVWHDPNVHDSRSLHQQFIDDGLVERLQDLKATLIDQRSNAASKHDLEVIHRHLATVDDTINRLERLSG